MKILPALPPPSNRYAQTAAPSSLPACATDLFLFRHFSLASPGQCQVNLLQKKRKHNKTQRSNSAWLSTSQSPPKHCHKDRPSQIHSHKKNKKQNCTTLLGVEPSRDRLVVRPSLGGRRVLAPLSSSSSTIKSGRRRTAAASLYVAQPLASVKCLSRG